MKKNNNKKERNYEEFIPMYFSWVPINKQKENAKRLENITKKEGKSDN